LDFPVLPSNLGPMQIRLGCELVLSCLVPTPVLALVHPHTSRRGDLLTSERLWLSPDRTTEVLSDRDGNRSCRFVASAGTTSLSFEVVVHDEGCPDPVESAAGECPIGALPIDTYRYLNPSRYCDTDRLAAVAWGRFGTVPPGWERVQAICDWVHAQIRFDYDAACSDRTAFDAMREGRGVCRDYAHLAIALCRCLNIPARYCTGYLGYTGVEPGPAPIDYSAWFEVFLEDRWYVFDARYNVPRIGRVLIARGRDAADVPFLRSFGEHQLTGFRVITEVVPAPSPAEGPEGEQGCALREAAEVALG
jgi:transglutaminase-like putative cysteine protease